MNGEHPRGAPVHEPVQPVGRPLTVLQVMLDVSPEGFNNQFCIPGRNRISVCTFFPGEAALPEGIDLFDGDGTIPGFRRALKGALAARRYDVLHAHGPIDGFLFMVFRGLSRKGVGRTVFTVHHSFTNSNLKWRNRLLLLPIFARYDRVICVGQASKDSLPGLYRRVVGRRLGVIPNGVDLARADRILASHGPARADGRFRVVSAGRLIPLKNPFTVLDAFVEGASEPAELIYVGTGPLEDELARRAAGTPRGTEVSMTGLIPRNSVYPALAGADLFISASTGEGMPMAVLEALACRTPVVLSDIAPHREVAGGVDFIPLVDPDDHHGFAAEIARFQGMSPEERDEVGERGRRLVEERFSLSAMVQAYEELFSRLAASRRNTVE